MYSVEAEYIDRVVQQYGPCKCSRRPMILHFMGIAIAFSNKGGRHCRWPDFRQGAGKSCLRILSPDRCSHRLGTLPPRTYRPPGRTAIGACLVTVAAPVAPFIYPTH